MGDWTAAEVMTALEDLGLLGEGPRRMRDLFDTAKTARDLPLDEVDKLMAEPPYAARMAAFCILDFQARARPGDVALRDAYLRHHDSIDAWDMVDRAAPWVVGSCVAGGPYDLLHDLAASPDPLRRRTAMTAPLWFVRHGTDADVLAGFELAATLHADADPLVHKPVGIFLAHAGERMRPQLLTFLAEHESHMPRPAARLARRRL
ncbi:3-methyladenine DNA glycosylase AlkD [Nocardioides thalensis]|uniref:3-methyladenine DNA glycosylase AlkD n=1 Tax=Nocardioides thalensis TaxID=1914755 RepID=A0A853C232_9ACTN|nr:DNA alkylation repair protein [Nocardioides thalensis]NYJ00413.1 3-methyladenine DNA glycosylase AlkD [Nocardioides thalensis]